MGQAVASAGCGYGGDRQQGWLGKVVASVESAGAGGRLAAAAGGGRRPRPGGSHISRTGPAAVPFAGSSCRSRARRHGSSIWAGVEAFTADDLPVIGASRKASNLSYSFGFCGSGFQMGPGTGKRLAQQILGEHSDISLDAFDVGRFAAMPELTDIRSAHLTHSTDISLSSH